MTIRDTDVRTSVKGLVVGMHVSRLDRPWLETTFPLQGLKIGGCPQSTRKGGY